MSIRTAEESERSMYASRLRDMQEAQKTWGKKARTCLERGDEDLARTALERKLDMQGEVDSLAAEVASKWHHLRARVAAGEALPHT